MTDAFLKSPTSRRAFLNSTANIVGVGAAISALPSLVRADDNVTVGVIYVGPRQDFGWNQSHWDAAKRIAAIDGVKVVEQENVPETAEVEKVMESMIELDGATVLMPTSFGYWPHIKKMAAKYPNVLFTHIGAIWKDGDPANVIGYRGYMEDPHYLCGIAAANATKTGKIGFLGSKPLYFIYNNCNGFLLGARSVNPEITCNAVITGDWNNPVKEAETTNSLIDQGCDVIMANVDSAKVAIETAERRGVFTCGYHSDCSSLAPNGFLTGAEWNWASAAEFVKDWKNNAVESNLVRGGFEKDMVRLSPFGPSVSEATKAAIETAKAGFMDGSLQLYQGPVNDNKGNVVVADGEVARNDDAAFKVGVKFFVDGVIG